MKKISIIAITWNSLEYIKETTPKLLNLQYPNLEIIYVDNGSTDGTLEYLQSHKQVKVISNSENLGISKAKNIGVKQATGDYVLMLDDDMLIENPNFLTNIIKFYEGLDNPAFVMPLFINSNKLEEGITRIYGAVYDIWGLKVRQPEVDVHKIMNAPKPFKIAIAQGGAMFIKKTIWEQLGGFDESQKFNLDDDDISTRAYIFGYNNYLYNDECIVHLGIERRMDKERYAKNDLTYMSGKHKALLKNFSGITLSYMLFLATGRMFAEAIYHALQFRSMKILWANFKSFGRFIVDLPDTLQKRRFVQKNRKAKDRSILQFKTPRF
jgi:GT2 family glycosyltransferase